MKDTEKIKNIFNTFKEKINSNSKKENNSIWVDDLFWIWDNYEKEWLKWSHLSLSKASEDDIDNIIWLVNDIILQAILKHASDIHIEPNDKNVQIRFRVDGNFILFKEVDLKKSDAIVARIKIMSYLRIDEHRLPQDWKINFNLFWWKTIDLRVSILPTIYWEKVVIRVLKKDEKPPELKDLWILPYNMVKIKRCLNETSGMILAVWPTWSWKTTTLFSILSHYSPFENNISTLEDPVEYRISWVNHSQINPAIWFDFASWLRALLRQDPDIIMVWEIRDQETAKLRVEASITWHLVFSTLHTNSAVHTIQRLINLWIDPLLFSSSLKMIISQRLVRKLCPYCKEKYSPDSKVRQAIIAKVWKYIKDKENFFIYKNKEGWCSKCNNTWFKGRIWIYEVLEMTEKLEELLIRNASRVQLEIQAIWDWMVPIKHDALIKVVLWETSLQEVLGVLWSW